MNHEQMNEQQRRQEALFVEYLSRHGWKADATAQAIRSGMSVTPEGHALGENRHSNLAAELFLEEGILKLLVNAKEERKNVRLRFKYGDHLDMVIDWIVARQDDLSVADFTTSLPAVVEACEWAAYVDDAGTEYRLGRQQE